MRIGTLVKLAAFGLVAAVAVLALTLSPGRKAPTAQATSNPLPPLIGCANVDASPDNKVTVADILSVLLHYGKTHGQSGYEYIWDPVMPYNQTSPTGTGQITVGDILSVVLQYGDTCPLLDTQIAVATRAIVDPTFTSTLCDPTYATAMNCGGDPQFLTEDVSFLAGKGYRRGSTDVPGQGIHYVSFANWDAVFNAARPEGLVYKGGVLVAQLYYVDGDVVGWGSAPTSNVRAVNTDSLCSATAGEPPNTGCSWTGTLDGWHWHANLCTAGIGQANAFAFPGVGSQAECAGFASTAGISCTFSPAPNFNCAWDATVGWMGHLWNWLPNANYTNAINPGPGGLNECQTVYCNTTEANGRFADCFPDGGSWNAYNCPQ